MESLLNYLLRVSAGVSLVYVFYYVVLSRLTFYQWNRAYLLSHVLLCFFLPLVDVSNLFVTNEVAGQNLMNSMPVIGVPVQGRESVDLVSLVVSATVLFGVIVFGIRVWIQYQSLTRVRKSAKLWHTEDNVRFFVTEKNISPFSFGNGIYVNPRNHSDAELENIILHEIVHVKQEHTVDLIAGEILCVLNWFNPFAWLLRRAIRQNLEFIADSRVLSQGKDRKTYQYFLLKVVGSGAFTVGNHFSISNLKKRIIMMNKIKTARLHLSRFLFAIPLLVFILVSFRNEWSTEATPTADTNLLQDTVPVKKSDPARESRPKSIRSSKAASKSRSLSESSSSPNSTANANPSVNANLSVNANPSVNASPSPTASPSPVVSPNPTANPNPRPIAIPNPTANPNPNPNPSPIVNAQIPGKMLVIVDGVKKPRGFDFHTIPDSTIISINVLKGASAVEKYGAEGKDGVLEITTSSGKGRAPVRRAEDPGATEIDVQNKSGKAKLIVIDGVRQPSSFNISSDLPRESRSINVLDGQSAVRLYGTEGANGVIEITTRQSGNKESLRKVNEDMKEVQLAMLDKQSSLQREANEMARLQGADARDDRDRVDEALQRAMENQRTITRENSKRLQREAMDLKRNRAQLESELRNEHVRENKLSKAQQKRIRKEIEAQQKKQQEFVKEYQLNSARDLHINKVYLRDLQKRLAEQQKAVEETQERINADRNHKQKKREVEIKRRKQSQEDSRRSRQSQP